MADKPTSTSLQPSNSGNVMFLFLNKCLLSYIMKRSFINRATYEG